MTSFVTPERAARGRRLLDQLNGTTEPSPNEVLVELTRVKVLFQVRTIARIVGAVPPETLP